MNAHVNIIILKYNIVLSTEDKQSCKLLFTQCFFTLKSVLQVCKPGKGLDVRVWPQKQVSPYKNPFLFCKICTHSLHSLNRYCKNKTTAFAFFGFNPNFAIMPRNNLLTNRQTQPGAPGLPPGRIAQLLKLAE